MVTVKDLHVHNREEEVVGMKVALSWDSVLYLLMCLGFCSEESSISLNFQSPKHCFLIEKKYPVLCEHHQRLQLSVALS
jgi:hypothetical protein